MPSAPETRYAKSGDLNIAYQVAGEGSLDLIYLPGWISNVEVNWEEPGRRRRRARKVELEELERNGSHKMDLDRLAPSVDDAFKNRLATYFRRSASPGAAVALMRMNTQLDVREVLPWIQAPTLVLHRTDDQDASVEEGR